MPGEMFSPLECSVWWNVPFTFRFASGVAPLTVNVLRGPPRPP